MFASQPSPSSSVSALSPMPSPSVSFNPEIHRGYPIHPIPVVVIITVVRVALAIIVRILGIDGTRWISTTRYFLFVCPTIIIIVIRSSPMPSPSESADSFSFNGNESRLSRVPSPSYPRQLNRTSGLHPCLSNRRIVSVICHANVLQWILPSIPIYVHIRIVTDSVRIQVLAFGCIHWKCIV